MNPAEWQAAFVQSLSNGLSPALGDTFADSLYKSERFAVYQNNIAYSLTQALGDLYPISKQLVGDAFFKGTALAYLKKHPPKQAAMVYFAWDFPIFLAGFEHTQSIAYLADVAQLELDWHRAYHAADAKTMAANDFQDIPATVFENARCQLHPSLHLLASYYPIFSIWQLHQGENKQKTINIDEPQAVVIVRSGYEPQVTLIDSATYHFYRLLQDNYSIYEAAAQVSKMMSCNIAEIINLGIEQGYFSQLHV
jgi:hypothetical protein